MVKIVRKKVIKKNQLLNFSFAIFAITFCAFLFSMIYVKALNYNLSIQEGKLSADIIKTSNDVANLELEVKQLDNRERILEIAEENGFVVNQTSIVSVVEDSNAE